MNYSINQINKIIKNLAYDVEQPSKNKYEEIDNFEYLMNHYIKNNDLIRLCALRKIFNSCVIVTKSYNDEDKFLGFDICVSMPIAVKEKIKKEASKIEMAKNYNSKVLKECLQQLDTDKEDFFNN